MASRQTAGPPKAKGHGGGGGSLPSASPASTSLPLPPSQTAPPDQSSSTSGTPSTEDHQAEPSAPHRRSPSLPAASVFANPLQVGPQLVHPAPSRGTAVNGTTSNRPPVLQVETSLFPWMADGGQHSIGRSSEIEVSPSRSANSSPVSRFHNASPLAGPRNDASTVSLAVTHAQHPPSNLRHSSFPSQSSPTQSHAPVPNPAFARPGLVSYHSHMTPDEALPWPERLRLACTSPETGRWQMPQVLTPYVPFMAWAGTSVGFLVVFTFWRQELFHGLDTMSVSLAEMGLLGKTIMGLLIFATTFPPLPLYSTLIILSGYAFGAWDGFVISYIAALSGALVVFLLSRSLFRGAMIRMLSRSPSLARVIHAIECRPSLLFLIRLAPYPYNIMNTLLASSRTLSLKVYTTVTGVSLFKLIIHTTIGSTIHNWGDHYSSPNGTPSQSDDGINLPSTSPGLTQEQIDAAAKGQMIQKTWSVIGIGLCIGLFIYLTIVARNAVNETASPTGTYAALPTTDMSDLGQRGRSMSRSSDSFDGIGGAGAGGGQGRSVGHNGGRTMSVGGLEGIAGLGLQEPKRQGE